MLQCLELGPRWRRIYIYIYATSAIGDDNADKLLAAFFLSGGARRQEVSHFDGHRMKPSVTAIPCCCRPRAILLSHALHTFTWPAFPPRPLRVRRVDEPCRRKISFTYHRCCFLDARRARLPPSLGFSAMSISRRFYFDVRACQVGHAATAFRFLRHYANSHCPRVFAKRLFSTRTSRADTRRRWRRSYFDTGRRLHA